MEKIWTAEKMAKLQELWNDGVKIKDILIALNLKIKPRSLMQKVYNLRRNGFRFNKRNEGTGHDGLLDSRSDCSLLERM